MKNKLDVLKKMNNSKVMCLGHISADIIIHRSNLERLKIGGTIQSNDLRISGGGSAANVAFWMGVLNQRVEFIGVIGNDLSGLFLKSELDRVNVKSHFKYSKKYPSASILIIVEPNGERSFIINGKSQDDLEWEDLPLSDIKSSKIFYTSAYTLENPPICNTMIELLEFIQISKKEKPEVILNLAAYTTVKKQLSRLRSKVLGNIDILIGNIAEYQELLNTKLKLNELEPIILSQLHEIFPNIKIIILTNGEKGSNFYKLSESGHIPAPKICVVDTTGAGDGFTAGFISSYVLGKNLPEAVHDGVTLGSYICQGYGARYKSNEYFSYLRDIKGK